MHELVADLMTRDPIVVRPETSITVAISLFGQHHISGLPVVDDRGKLVGMISATDLMWREKGIEMPLYIMFLDGFISLQNPIKQQRELHKVLGQTVGEVMSTDPISITTDRTLATAAKLMAENRVRRLPVVLADRQVVGVISEGDIVRAMCQELSQTIDRDESLSLSKVGI
jgi:CBS domain-containing protein